MNIEDRIIRTEMHCQPSNPHEPCRWVHCVIDLDNHPVAVVREAIDGEGIILYHPDGTPTSIRMAMVDFMDAYLRYRQLATFD